MKMSQVMMMMMMMMLLLLQLLLLLASEAPVQRHSLGSSNAVVLPLVRN